MLVCVTGDLGFIGGHLAKRLLEEGHEVLGWDIKAGFDVRTINPSDLQYVKYLFHLAALPRVPLSIEKPLETHDHNINGTLRVLWAAKEAGVKRVIYSSSSSIYGEQPRLPLVERMSPNPMSPYGTQKLVGEYYARNFAELYGLETVSLRYFNVYGEGMTVDNPYSAAIARFLDFAKKGEKLPVYGGKQTRDFTYVGDVVEANMLAMKAHKVGRGEAINIGSGQNHSIEDIAKIISDNIEFSAQRKGECMDTIADIRKADKLLKWQPKTKLPDWLKCAV